MANWIGIARSNYVKVRDPSAFIAWAESLNLDVWTSQTRENPTGTIADPPDPEALYAIGSGDGDGWPSSLYDEETDTDRDVDVVEEISRYLADGEIAVLMQSGHEKMRYVDGYAVAVDSTGKTVEIVLDNIYEEALKAFGKLPTPARY